MIRRIAILVLCLLPTLAGADMLSYHFPRDSAAAAILPMSCNGTNCTLASGQLLLPAGTAANPSLALGGEQTGPFRSAAARIGWSVTGTERLNLNGVALFPTATAGLTLGASGGRWSAGNFGGQTLTTTVTPLWDGSVTWNDAGTSHRGIKLVVTETADAATSRYFEILGGAAGTTDEFYVGKGGSGYFGGALTSASSIIAGAANRFQWGSTSSMLAPSDGVIGFYNAALTDFSRLQFGGTTSSFPSLKRSTTDLHVRLADDSAYTGLTAGTITSVGASVISGNNILFSGSAYMGQSAASRIYIPSDGVIKFTNAAATGFTRLNFGGDSASFPAWTRNAANMELTAADGTSAGQLLLPAGSAVLPSLSFAGSTGLGTYRIDANTMCLTAWGSGCNLEWDGNAGLQIGYGQPIGFSSGSTTTTPDLFLRRDAANTLALRNGTNAQTFNVYETYTDASNYRRAQIFVSSGTARFGWEGVGSGGTSGNTIIQSGAGSGSSVYIQTTAALRWLFDGSGHFLTQTDNTYDIGASGASRPRNIYAGGTVFANILNPTASGGIAFGTNGYLYSTADGRFIMANAALSSFDRLQLGGTTSSFPAIKRNGAGIDVRLADDSAYATIRMNQLKLNSGTTIADISDGVTGFYNAATTSLVRVKATGAPSVAGSCGTSPSVAGQDTAMVVTTGTGSPTSCAVTFQSTWTTAPVCVASAQTTTTPINVVTTATTVTVSSAALTASEKLYILCVGY